jgi:hypothetical protein
LDLDGTLDRLHDTGELGEDTISHELNDATAMFGDTRKHKLAEMAFQSIERPGLVLPHQPAVARDISGKDGGESTLTVLISHNRLLPSRSAV